MTLPSYHELQHMFPKSRDLPYDELVQIWSSLANYHHIPSADAAILTRKTLSNGSLTGGMFGFGKKKINKLLPEPCRQDFKTNKDIDYTKLHPRESYLNDTHQHVTPLYSNEYIYGMQNVPGDCKLLAQMLKFIQLQHGIKRMVCLQCSAIEGSMWMYVGKLLNNRVSFNELPIKDYGTFTFEQGIQILKYIQDPTPIIFHCTAGYGRTGAVMNLITRYFIARVRPEILTEALPLTNVDYIDSVLAKEYSVPAAEEFYHDPDHGGVHVISISLRSARINMIQQVIAYFLSFELKTPIAYRVYAEAVVPAIAASSTALKNFDDILQNQETKTAVAELASLQGGQAKKSRKRVSRKRGAASARSRRRR
jgi:hypothetical protein